MYVFAMTAVLLVDLCLKCFQTVAFDNSVFAPYLAVTVTELIKLVVEADSMESKRHILGSLNTIIERMDTEV